MGRSVAWLLLGCSLTTLQAQTPAAPGKTAGPRGETCSVNILSPFDAHVFVDGKMLIGADEKPILTPATIQNFPVGIHEIAVAREGFNDVVVTRSISDNVELKFTQNPGKSALLARQTENICFAPPTPTPIPTPTPVTETPTPVPPPPLEGEIPPPPKPLGMPNHGPLKGVKRTLPKGLVEVQYNFDEEAETGDFKPMSQRTLATWQPGQLNLRNPPQKTGLTGVVLRVPMEIHKASIKGRILQGDHILWFANCSPPKGDADWKWRPLQGAAGVWRADGAIWVLNARPKPPEGRTVSGPTPFDFDVFFVPTNAAQPDGNWTVRWDLFGKRLLPEAEIKLDPKAHGWFAVGTWGSDVVIYQITLVGKVKEPE